MGVCFFYLCPFPVLLGASLPKSRPPTRGSNSPENEYLLTLAYEENRFVDVSTSLTPRNSGTSISGAAGCPPFGFEGAGVDFSFCIALCNLLRRFCTFPSSRYHLFASAARFPA